MRRRADGQRGVTLVMTLLMLAVVLLLATAAAQIALQGEKSARNDRDRQIAFRAAEAALHDAEMDIEGMAGSASSRAHLFTAAVLHELSLAQATCGVGESNPLLGICRSADAAHAWQAVDFLSEGENMAAVPYGRFTGQVFPAGEGPLSALPPRYIVEFLPYRRVGTSAADPDYLYRITAVGFGTRAVTQVALQVFYRKAPS